MKRWVKANPYAQAFGWLCYEFGYTPVEVSELTAFQYNFLLAWLEWYYERLERLRRRR